MDKLTKESVRFWESLWIFLLQGTWTRTYKFVADEIIANLPPLRIPRLRHHRVTDWDPYFENAEGQGINGSQNVALHLGATALLDCRVAMLSGKKVSVPVITETLASNIYKNNEWIEKWIYTIFTFFILDFYFISLHNLLFNHHLQYTYNFHISTSSVATLHFYLTLWVHLTYQNVMK